MVVIRRPDPTEIEPSTQETEVAQLASEALTHFKEEDGSVRLIMTKASGERLEAPIPERAVGLLSDILVQMAKGRAIRVFSLDAELTPHEAAEILRVSRPHLVKLLDGGAIPYRRVGSHRRIRLDDLVAYQEQERQSRRKALDELTAESERLGLYE